MAAGGSFTNLIVSSSQPPQRLEFHPLPQTYGSNYGSFEFKVIDDGAEEFAMALAPNTMTIEVASVNDPPTLDAIPDPRVMPPDADPPPILLTGLTTGGEASQTLSLQAISSHPEIIPHPIIEYAPPDEQATLRYSITPRTEGTAVITVSVQDDGIGEPDGPSQVERQFTVTISPYFFDWSQWFGLPSDPEVEGGRNLLAYAFGLKPGLADSAPLILNDSVLVRRGFPLVHVAHSENKPLFSLLYGLRRGPGFETTVELSANLVEWESAANPGELVTEDDVVQIFRLPFPDRLPNGLAPQFARVRVRAF